MLDDAQKYREALRSGAKLRPETRKLHELALTDKDGKPIAQAVHQVTTNACWRPDLYLDNGRACDGCGLYQFCKATIKRLKSVSSQPKDGNPRYESEELRKQMAKDDEDFEAYVIEDEEPALPLEGRKARPALRVKNVSAPSIRPRIILRRKS